MAPLNYLMSFCIVGDPRIQEAKVIWVESDATSWVENKQKVSKGEPALEIIVEKDEAVRNGDAWRTTIDACIPVLNLIDTKRSIPYGIQQVRELLGISCAFDQVVQVGYLPVSNFINSAYYHFLLSFSFCVCVCARAISMFSQFCLFSSYSG